MRHFAYMHYWAIKRYWAKTAGILTRFALEKVLGR